MDLWFTQKRVNSQTSHDSGVHCEQQADGRGGFVAVVTLRGGGAAGKQAGRGKILTLGRDSVLRLELGEEREPIEIRGEELWRLCNDPLVVFACEDAGQLEKFAEIADGLGRQSNMVYVDDSFCDSAQLAARLARARAKRQ